MDETDHKNLEDHAQRLYRDAAERLDSASRARLAAARARAVDAVAPGQKSRWLLPAAAVAGTAAVGLAVMMSARNPADFGQMASDDPAQDDVELLLATDSLDMLSELDFYLWLDTEPDAG